ncbi:MAG: hypothetical protein ND866_20355 [Pyrinomonadaceae bacterium]|nr:hypothetical protein [Pyrinomonadaceae bacterium]
MAGHLRHLLAEAAASNNFDLRDWMRPTEATELLDRVGQVLGASKAGDSLSERLGREVWIDFVADTGDDHDVSLAVGRMLFNEYTLSGDEPCTLPRGDLLLFGGDTAYPVANANELERRLLGPWNHVLSGKAEGRRVLLGIPGNHDWYDGLDGFGRLFRRNALEDLTEPTITRNERSTSALNDASLDRVQGFVHRQLHIDEMVESVHLAEEALNSLRALLLGSQVKTVNRLGLAGYTAVQEASFWALPLAPGLDLWGVDRQLRNADFRQRLFFSQRRAKAQPRRIFFVAPEPALAFGDPHEAGSKLLEACGLSLDLDRLFYLSGDAHHYERLTVQQSMHIISGGGGAFVHGSRISQGSGSTPPEFVYPDRRSSLRLALGMPLGLAGGTAGLLPHGLFALIATVEMLAPQRGPIAGGVAAALATLLATIGLSLSVRARLERPAATWAISILFGLILGLGPLGLWFILPLVLPWLGLFAAVVLGHAFIGSFALGLFLLLLEVTGLDHQQGFAALGHPGFRHFVRLCVQPGGKIEGFVIGKDDPVGEDPAVLIDRFIWD